MKQKEWNRRFGMNLEGVQMLGVALLRRAELLLVDAKATLLEFEISEEAEKEFLWGHDAKYFEKNVKTWKSERQAIRFRLTVLDTSADVIENASTLRPMDFRFRWDNLRYHLALICYLSDDQPDFAKKLDRHTPISKRWDDTTTSALSSIFFSEYERLTGLDPDDVPYLSEREDFEFYLVVWKHCELEPKRGAPTGRRYADGCSNAASYAHSLKAEAEKLGQPISLEEAIRRAIKKFDVISSADFDAHPDKSITIVSDALGEEGRLGGAKKAVRKQLDIWNAEE